MPKRKATGAALVIVGIILVVLGVGPWDPFRTDVTEVPMIVVGAVSTAIGCYKLFAPKGVRSTRP